MRLSAGCGKMMLEGCENMASFPRSANEALAYLYVQSQDLTGKTVSEIVKMYVAALKETNATAREINESDT